MKKKLLLIVLAAGLLTGCGKSIPKLSNGNEAFVSLNNGTKYSVDDIWSEFKDAYALRLTLNKIDMEILEKEYKDKKDDTKKYIEGVEASLKANFVNENGEFDEEALKNALSNYGYGTIDDYLEMQKTNYLTNMAATDYAKTKVSKKQIKDHYNKKTVGDIHCVHVLVKPEGTSDQDSEKALNKANDILKAIKKDIKSGTKPLDAFKKYENDKEVTYEDLDYFNKGDMVSEFEDAAYALKKNAYTNKPVKTTYGYHIILKLDQKAKPALKDVEKEIKESLAEEMVQNDDKVSVNAMIELRKKYGVKWYDKDIEENYNKYMNYLLNKKDE